MIWGNFTLTHIISLIVVIPIIIGLYYALHGLDRKWQIVILGILSFSGIAAIIYNLVAWNSPLEYLPLHLCSINAILLPIAVFTKNKTVGNLLLFWSLGALIALVLNNAMAEAELFSLPFSFYYFPHILEFAIPILLFKLGIIKKDIKCIISTLGITLAIFTVVHFINLWINAYCISNNICDTAGNVIHVNYMFTVTPDNPLLVLFYNIIPHPYWYLYLALPIIAIYLLTTYLPTVIRAKINQNKKENA